MSRPLRALIVDDEPAARRLLARLLAKEPHVEVAGTCRHGGEALHWLRESSVDLLFLDIQMPGMNGFEMLAALESPPAVVFVTAHDDFAVRAFEAEAWDYLLKPFDEERLRQALERVRKRLGREEGRSDVHDLAMIQRRLTASTRASSRASTRASSTPAPSMSETSTSAPPSTPVPATPSPPAAHLERLAIPQGRGRVTILMQDVRCIQAESNYARFHLEDRSYLSRISLSQLESKLDKQRFIRIHRSTIVNIDYLQRVDSHGHGDLKLTLTDGRRLTLSRRYRQRFEEIVQSLP